MYRQKFVTVKAVSRFSAKFEFRILVLRRGNAVRVRNAKLRNCTTARLCVCSAFVLSSRVGERALQMPCIGFRLAYVSRKMMSALAFLGVMF